MAMAASSIPMNDSRSHRSDPLSTVRNVWHILPSLPGVSLPVYGSMPWPSDPVGECPYKAEYHKLQMPTARWFPSAVLYFVLPGRYSYFVPSSPASASFSTKWFTKFRENCSELKSTGRFIYLSEFLHWHICHCQRKLLQMFLYGCFLHTITYICAGFTGRIHRNHRFSVSCHIATGPVSAITGNIPAIHTIRIHSLLLTSEFCFSLSYECVQIFVFPSCSTSSYL